MEQKPRIRITQTLLSNWLYVWKKDDGYEAFMKCLNREKEPPTQAMLDGIKFEGMVNAALDGAPVDPTHKWATPVRQLAKYLDGAKQQVTLFKESEVDGQPVLYHGVLDFLKAGVIYDTKFSKTYHVGKYFDSPQTAMYLALVPEAKQFQYIICDGTWVYRERYWRDEVPPIDYTTKNFLRWISDQGLMETLTEKWAVTVRKDYSNGLEL